MHVNSFVSSCFGDHFAACQFIQGDFTNLDIKDWRDADVVFANSTCYDDEMMDKISRIARKLICWASFAASLTLFNRSGDEARFLLH
jgi:hypothetical protein